MGHAAVRVVARAAGALADLSAIAALSLGVPSWTERGGWLEGTLVDADVFETRSSVGGRKRKRGTRRVEASRASVS